MKIRIIVAEGLILVLQGVKALLENESDLEVIAEAVSGEETFQKAEKFLPDVVVLGMSNEAEALKAIRGISAKLPSVKVLAFSTNIDLGWVYAALEAGAAGCLLKECKREDLLKGIRSVAAGYSYLSPQAASIVVHKLKRPRDSNWGLTKREVAVLCEIVNGRNTKDIAVSSGVSIKTVESQRTTIAKKLQIHSIAELTKFAIREGLTSV